MKILKKSTVFCGIVILLGLHGAELTDLIEKNDWQDSPNLTVLPDDVLQFQKGQICSTETVRIRPGKKTTLSGEFRTLPGKQVRVFFAFSPMDEEKRNISANNVNVIKGTETILTAPVAKADKKVKVADGSKFPKNSWLIFDARDDYSDLPNRNMNWNSRIVKTEKMTDGTWEITLHDRCCFARPAGTRVRCHGGGGNQYVSIRDLKGDQWITLKGTVTGTAKYGGGGKNWRPGSKYARVVIFCNGKAPVQFRNVKITEE